MFKTNKTWKTKKNLGNPSEQSKKKTRSIEKNVNTFVIIRKKEKRIVFLKKHPKKEYHRKERVLKILTNSEAGLNRMKDQMEIQKTALEKNERVLICDDLLATGGTAKAAAKLIEKLDAKVIGFAFIIELTDLKGIEKIKEYRIESLVQY